MSIIVSRNHCKIYFDQNDNSWKIKSNNALNGTFLNNNKIINPFYDFTLKVGDRIGIGVQSKQYDNASLEIKTNESYFVYKFVNEYMLKTELLNINNLCEQLSIL